MKRAVKIFIALIAVIGVIRFVLSTAGISNDVVKYASMSVVIMAGSLYFGATTSTHKDRLKAAYLLRCFYGESLLTGIAVHTLGHFVGGLTWEPLMVFIVMEIVWAIAAGGRWVRAHATG